MLKHTDVNGRLWTEQFLKKKLFFCKFVEQVIINYFYLPFSPKGLIARTVTSVVVVMSSKTLSLSYSFEKKIKNQKGEMYDFFLVS